MFHLTVGKIILIPLLIAVSGVQFYTKDHQQQSSFGVYMIAATKKQCVKKLQTLDEKKVCLMGVPVLTIDDVSHITAIRYDLANEPYFSLVVRDSGFNKLKGLAAAFPNQDIAVVVDDTVVGFLNGLDRLRGTRLKMTAQNKSQITLNSVHAKLLEVLPMRN